MISERVQVELTEDEAYELAQGLDSQVRHLLGLATKAEADADPQTAQWQRKRAQTCQRLAMRMRGLW